MDDPIRPELRDEMQGVAKAIADSLPAGYGFTLLVFDMGTPTGFMNYISNAERESMVVAMKEFIARSEGRMPTTTETMQ
jgi:hypothetical protein